MFCQKNAAALVAASSEHLIRFGRDRREAVFPFFALEDHTQHGADAIGVFADHVAVHESVVGR